MSQETTSWVSHGNGSRFVLQEVKLGPLKADEVRVKLRATGICHTDILAADGDLPAQLPAILGHEGAGEIVEVGPGISHLQKGDRVVLSFASCSACHSCLSGVPTACRDFLALNLLGTRTENVHTIPSTSTEDEQPNEAISLTTKFFGQSTFATFANVNVRSCVKLNPTSLKLASGGDVPWARLASLGCGFMTGSGTVLNVCKPGPGSSIGVFGVGAVGLAAIAAARNLSAASTIIAVDISPSKLEVATAMGATHCFNSRQGNDACIQAVKDATGGRGLDFAIDTTGNVNVIGTMLRSLTAYGTGIQIAGPSSGNNVELHPSFMVNSAVTYRGIVMGAATPQIFIPALLDYYLQGRFPVVDLVKEYNYRDLNIAIEEMKAGSVVKAVLVWD